MESTIDLKGVALVNGLQRAAQGGSHEEGFSDFLRPVAKVGIQVLPTDTDAIASSISGGESASEPKPNHDSIQEHIETLCHFSIMGEAALNALLDIPPKAMHEEGFFSSIVDVVKNIGSTVIRVAPSVTKTVVPLVLGAVSGGSDFGSDKPPSAHGHSPKLRKSWADLSKDLPVTGPEILIVVGDLLNDKSAGCRPCSTPSERPRVSWRLGKFIACLSTTETR